MRALEELKTFERNQLLNGYCSKEGLPSSPHKAGLALGLSSTKGPCTSTISGAVINRTLIYKYKLLRVIATNFCPIENLQIFTLFCCNTGKLLKGNIRKQKN